MKIKIYSVFAVLALSLTAWSQGGVGINETGAAPDNSAGLDVDFTNKVFLPPRMTTAQRDAIYNVASGAIIYNTSLSCLQVNDGTPALPVWNCISSVAGLTMGSISTLNCAGAIHNNYLTNGVAALNISTNIPYTGGNGGLYLGQTVTSTGVTGLTATLTAGSFEIGNGQLVYTISGTPASVGTASFAISIGGQSCSFTRYVSAPGVPNICNPSNPTAIVEVTNSVTGKIWMDRNLGANRVATSANDAQAYGHLYQWGRGSDGHQCVNRYSGDGVTTSSNTTADSPSTTDSPGHGNYILNSQGNFDWRTVPNNNLWQGVNGINNPCPIGYRLPTEAEFVSERASWSSLNSAGAYNSTRKFALGGQRMSSGTLNGVGTFGYYWTSTVRIQQSRDIFFDSITSGLNSSNRNQGRSVRCIKN